MAAKSSAIRGVASCFPKRFANQVRTRDPAPLSAFSGYSRNVHTSVYDKNVDEHVCPAMVPDDIVQQKSEYWAPNPHTGIFGPAAEATPRPRGAAATSAGGSESVLDQKAFFRDVFGSSPDMSSRDGQSLPPSLQSCPPFDLWVDQTQATG